MTNRSTTGCSRAAGFSLIELMIVVVIVAILASIAIPAYNAQILKSHRTEAKMTLQDLAGREERYYNANPTLGYTNVPANVGYTAAPPFTNIPVGNNYYTVTITPVAAAPPAPASYTIVATPVGNQLQDLPCSTFTLSSTGAQSATGSGSNPSVDCWK